MWYHLYVEPKNITQMNLSTKQKETHRHREQTCVCQGGRVGKDGLGAGDYQIQTILHRMVKQQGPTV